MSYFTANDLKEGDPLYKLKSYTFKGKTNIGFDPPVGRSRVFKTADNVRIKYSNFEYNGKTVKLLEILNTVYKPQEMINKERNLDAKSLKADEEYQAMLIEYTENLNEVHSMFNGLKALHQEYVNFFYNNQEFLPKPAKGKKKHTKEIIETSFIGDIVREDTRDEDEIPEGRSRALDKCKVVLQNWYDNSTEGKAKILPFFKVQLQFPDDTKVFNVPTSVYEQETEKTNELLGLHLRRVNVVLDSRKPKQKVSLWTISLNEDKMYEFLDKCQYGTLLLTPRVTQSGDKRFYRQTVELIKVREPWNFDPVKTMLGYDLSSTSTPTNTPTKTTVTTEKEPDTSEDEETTDSDSD